MDPAASVAHALSTALGGRWSVRPLHASGFCATWRAEGAGGALFVKSLPSPQAEVLEAEADGLSAIAATATIRVPAVAALHHDAALGQTVLALEWLHLHSPDSRFGARFGEKLAALHRAPPVEAQGRFGWRRDNFLGATPQRNRWSEASGLPGWIAFFAQERLGAMRERLCAQDRSAALPEAIDAVIAVLPRSFADGHTPRASLIHGDLWSGNWGMLADGTPVIYDPAVSCSDAEAELAMMELFGKAPAGFVEAYRQGIDLHEGYAQRRGLYQLYHLLNHALLFGAGYVAQSLVVAKRLAHE